MATQEPLKKVTIVGVLGNLPRWFKHFQKEALLVLDENDDEKTIYLYSDDQDERIRYLHCPLLETIFEIWEVPISIQRWTILISLVVLLSSHTVLVGMVLSRSHRKRFSFKHFFINE